MLYNFQFAERARCSDEEKLKCLALIERFCDLAQLAWTRGLLALEDDIDTQPHHLLRLGLGLICDGTDPETVRAILENHIYAESYQGCELLSRAIMLEGILALQDGGRAPHIRHILNSFLGEKFLKDHGQDEHAGFLEEKRRAIEILQSLGDFPPLDERTTILEDIVPGLDPRAMQRMSRELSDTTIVVALSGASSAVCDTFYVNVSFGRLVTLIKRRDNLGRVTTDAIVHEQQRIMNFLQKLDDAGEIVLGKGAKS